MTQFSIIGPDNIVHYRRPAGDPLIAEAKSRPGYMVITSDCESMLLPTGKHCADCGHVRQCVRLGVVTEPDTQRMCDWSPSRFVLSQS